MIEKDQRRQPRPWAGAFAVVYKATHAQGGDPFAVRVFTTESPERRERYELISAYLRTRKLHSLVGFEYRDRSIRSAGDGKWYPLIVMEWVQGETLFEWLRARCLAGTAAAVAKLAPRWLRVVKELAHATVAHGDLQHANVMVTDAGEVKLVDYDCLCVPALVGRRNLEVGVEPYQHPARNERTLLSLDLDNFSALMIYVAIRALAAEPRLWQKHVEQTGYDKLLFRPEDLRSPTTSALYYDLMQSPDEEVRDLSQQLFALFHAPIDQVPLLTQLTNSYAKVEQLLKRQEWAAAVNALNRRGQFRDAPEHLKPLIHLAYEHVCREQAWKAFQKLPAEISEKHDRDLLAAWNEALFAGFEHAELQRSRVVEARRRVTLLDRLYQVIQQSPRQMTLAGERGIAGAVADLPQGYKYSLQPRVRQARQRTAAIAKLERALNSCGEAGTGTAAGVVTAWQAVLELKCDGLVNAAWRPPIELAERRAQLLKSFGEIPETAPLDWRDRRILELWQEDLLVDCAEAAPWRQAHQAAIARRDLVARLRTAVQRQDAAAIAALMALPELANYSLPPEWLSAITAAQERIRRTEALEAALRDNELSAFHGLFDARLLRQFAERFAPYESMLSAWTRAEILPLEKLGLQPSANGKSVVRAKGPAGSHRVLWTWPEPRFTELCLLAVCAEEPGPQDNPTELKADYRVLVDRRSWEEEGGGQLIVAQPEWAGGCVVVWAAIDLGFRTLYSPPLVLGRLKGHSRWNLFG